MSVTVNFYSYVKDLVGTAQITETLPGDATLGDLFKELIQRFPKLAPMEKSLLLAVGVEYQPRSYILRPADEISIFPPVQGG
jgi:molybdopterin converting factor small subunit